MWAYNQISLSWDATGVDWYDVEVQDGGGRWNHLRSVYDNEVDMAGFDAATTYSFRVRGVESTWPDWSYTDYSAVVTPTTSAYQAAPTFTVTDDTSWNTAYVNAEAGDVIEILPGTVLTEKTALPWRAGPGKFVTIRSAAIALLPGFDQRVGPSDIGNMPQFRVQNQSAGAMELPAGRHHLTFEGIRFSVDSPVGYRTNFVVVFNKAYEDIDNDPHDIEFHRCYVDAPIPESPYTQTDSGFFSYGSARVVIKDSYIKEITGSISDTQAVGILRGHEWAINNCYAEAASETVLIGGSSHPDTDYNPHLFTFRRNHFSKPLYWKSDNPNYDGVSRRVKNLFELKTGKRVLLEDNVLENNWVAADQAYSILFTIREDGMSWAQISDVRIRYNDIKNITGGFSISAWDSNGSSLTANTERISVEHNLMENVFWGGGSARFIELNGSVYSSGHPRSENLRFRRNTLVSDYTVNQYMILSPSGEVAASWPDGQGVGGTFDVSGNITEFGTGNPPGIFQDGGNFGAAAMNAWAGAGKYTWGNNVQMGNAGGWNTETYFPGQLHALNGHSDVLFEDSVSDDWRLREYSPYYGMRGADVQAINDRTTHCVDGDWTS